MLILSWNVAGLSTTVDKIDKHYGDATKRRNNPSAAIRDYFRKHNADIVCIQEAKIPKGILENRREPLRCAHVAGYESFWSCCVDPTKRGFNGVVTYCKEGTVIYADSRPLKNPELDDQGRCVMTDHGAFVIFNVYVPAGGGQPLSYKMKFLHGLRAAMRNQRENLKKKVILVGDLNITHKEKDMFWGNRRLAIDQICREVRDNNGPKMPKWKQDLARSWPTIEEALKSRRPLAVKTTNPRTKAKFDKYRMMVEQDGKQILLGNHEEKPEICEYYFDFDACHYTCPVTSKSVIFQERNMIDIKTVAELMLKLARIEWNEQLLQSIAMTDGTTNRASPPRIWLNEVVENDKMIDCFRHFYPNVQGRFTCWDQYKNKRYENQGARIDYTLIDESLSRYLRKGEVSSLRCGDSSGEYDSGSVAAALCAATANGMYQPVSFAGGGIIEASQKALNTQFGKPHTGHVYTPPSYSDHIALSVLLDDELCSYDLELRENDKATKESQPHKKVRTINSYFSVAAANGTKKNNEQSNGSKTNVSRYKTKGSKANEVKKGPIRAFLKPVKSKLEASSTTKRKGGVFSNSKR